MLKEIGMGGFARIYLCKNLQTGEHLALKYMKAGKKKEVQSIVNEVGIMKICGKDCPNIVKCKDLYNYNKKIWIF
jgi:serine/threonine protein kinase